MAQQSTVLEHSRDQAVLRSLAGSDLYRDLDLTRLHACHTLEKLAFIALCHAMKRDVRWTIVLLQILLSMGNAILQYHTPTRTRVSMQLENDVQPHGTSKCFKHEHR